MEKARPSLLLGFLLALLLAVPMAGGASRLLHRLFPLPDDANRSPLVSFGEFGIAALTDRTVRWISPGGQDVLSFDIAPPVRLVRIINDHQIVVITDSALWLYTVTGPDHFMWYRHPGNPDRFLVDQSDSPKGFYYRAPDGTVSRYEFNASLQPQP